MVKLDNYIIEFHECKSPSGYIIEISEQIKIDKVSKVNKTYLFYSANRGISRARIKEFIISATQDAKLKRLLQYEYFL